MLMETLKYLVGYPQHLQARVHELIAQGRLGAMLVDKYRARTCSRTITSWSSICAST
jgi:hypothetical protein